MMIDIWLFVFVILGACVCTTFGFFLGLLFSCSREEPSKCESIEDILKREG